MNNYVNIGGNSNIKGYENGAVDGEFYIQVEFADGSTYLYNEQSCGKHLVQEMQSLAVSGKGLNSFISRNKPKYQSKS